MPGNQARRSLELSPEQVTRLTERDRQSFVEMLDDVSTRPSVALIKAAKRSTKQAG